MLALSTMIIISLTLSDDPHSSPIPQPTYAGGSHELNDWIHIREVNVDVKSDPHNNSLFGGYPVNIRPLNSNFNISCTIFTVVKLHDCIDNCYIGMTNGECVYNGVYDIYNGVGSIVYDAYYGMYIIQVLISCYFQ